MLAMFKTTIGCVFDLGINRGREGELELYVFADAGAVLMKLLGGKAGNAEVAANLACS
jgi:hypothetical protein